MVVNNAGESQSGPFEELPREALERLFQVNVLGHVDFTQRLLLAMRASARQGSGGRIVMVGSMLGSFPLGFRSSYVATKAAVKGFATAARRELAPHGIGISTVESGAIATGISERRTGYVDKHGPYARDYGRMLGKLNRNEAGGISAERVAREILRPIRATRPRALRGLQVHGARRVSARAPRSAASHAQHHQRQARPVGLLKNRGLVYDIQAV
ncbi:MULTISPECIES: SDR family NAD(P)-dependent oxidoreductase [unclassified Corynebacterium]|uniref:SDR family NAD(P)-dependent oxidoreductase n=1 Tax=unclassified Corynebacterium TaxID=2624378 RepID=UPI002882E6F4|nr:MULTISPECIES: SDR family NAD(P)-dependent oxidoreductase [unclassified Corynebacterium]